MSYITLQHRILYHTYMQIIMQHPNRFFAMDKSLYYQSPKPIPIRIRHHHYIRSSILPHRLPAFTQKNASTHNSSLSAIAFIILHLQ